MATVQSAAFTFTKLVVHDLEAMADFYCAVFGLHRGSRNAFEKGVAGEAIDEIALVANPGDRYGAVSLLKFVKRPAARNDEVILGFTTSAISPLLDRVRGSGGSIVGRVEDLPDQGIRVAFVRDPEGHLCEVVELVPVRG